MDVEKRTAEFPVSSEYPVERWYGYEILDHSPGAIRMDRFQSGAAHKDGHEGPQVGKIEKAWLNQSERRLWESVRYSKSSHASEVFQDVVDEIKQNVSLRYIVHEMVLEKEVDGVAYYRIIDWEPVHSCEETDPADPTVGHNRSDEEGTENVIPLNLSEASEEIRTQIENFNNSEGKNKGLKILLTNNSKRSDKKMTDEEKRELEEKQRKAIADAEVNGATRAAERIADIYAMVDDFQKDVPGINLREKAQDFIKDPVKTGPDFYKEVIKPARQDPNALRTPDTQLDMPDSDVRDYSMTKVVRAVSTGDFSDLKVEMEAHRALCKKLGRTVSHKSILVPYDIQKRTLPAIDLSRLPVGMRNMIVGTDASGGYTVKEQWVPQSFVELLFSMFTYDKLPIQVLENLSGNVPMLRELSEVSSYWVGEGNGPTQSDVTWARDTMTPKKVGALTGYSHEFLNQTSLSVEAYVNTKLARSVRKQILGGIISGTGTAAQPKGIKNWTGVGSVVGTAFSRDKALDLESLILDADAADLGEIKWLSRGSTRNTIKKIAIDTNKTKFLVSDDNKMIDYDYQIYSGITAGDLIGGIWQALILGIWSVLEITPNQFGTGFAAGDTVVRALTDVDVYVEYPEAFTYTEGVAAP